MSAATEQRRAALDYLQKSGFGIPEAKRMMKSFIALEGTTIGVNRSMDKKTTEVTIDKDTADRCRTVLKGLNLLSRESK